LKTFDFDIIEWTWGASLSPGNEQINRWSSKAAAIEGSLNYPGVRNKAIDAMLEALLRAETAADFTAAVRALDRVLMSGDYVIPLFFLPKVWVAYWSHLRLPAGPILSGYDLDSWWSQPATP
jgi:peptide/nickel transport system substrate-binding protein